MRYLFFSLLLGLPIGFAGAQIPDPQDVAAIQGQCGCHDVTFAYAETFSSDKQYQFKDRYTAKGTEWVFVEEENGSAASPHKLVIQHLLVAGDSLVIKHWREDWTYQLTSLLAFDQNATWKRRTLTSQQASRTWTQQVFEVDDSPRYEGVATWIHADGRHYWESTVDAPLPRREYTKRHDYNVMRRTNHHEILATGYVHEQDNDKIIRSEAGDELLVSEKGLNVYTRTDEAKCAVARAWWTTRRAYWADVRAVWADVRAGRPTVALRQQVKGMVLGKELDDLEKLAIATPGTTAASRDVIKQTMLKYLK